jgi:hypothetical protein
VEVNLQLIKLIVIVFFFFFVIFFNEEGEAELIERVGHLKTALVEKLKPWMEGRVTDFEAAVKVEVEELRKESYGAEILQHVGYIYVNEARQHLKGFLGLKCRFFQNIRIFFSY